jgi:hypothetical protein
VDAVVAGAWRTVFVGRFHPEVAGQEVASGIRSNPRFRQDSVGLRRRDRFLISTKRVGHEPAWWEVQAYVPGDWEEELERLSEEAERVKHEREKDRFGL